MQQKLARIAAIRLVGGAILSAQGDIEQLLRDDLEQSKGASFSNGIATFEDIERVVEAYRAIGIGFTLQADRLQAIQSGQLPELDEQQPLSPGAYHLEVLRTYAGGARPIDKLTLASFGLAGETGEVVDHIKKVIYAQHAIDFIHLARELGDILWYLVLACDAIGYSLYDIMQMNVAKLRKRYPDGFDPQRSQNRPE